MSQLERYELFITVAESRSLTEAAKKLGTTKASISKQIKKLEQELAIDLFSRANYRLTLTAFGKTFLEQCKQLKRTLDDTRFMAQSYHAKPKGVLNIIVFNYFATHLIFPHLKAFQKKYPDLKLAIDLSERIPDFSKEDYDIAIGFSLPIPEQEDIVQMSMGTTRYALCASPDYFKEHGKPKNIKDITKHKLISHNSRKPKHLKFHAPNLNIDIEPSLYVNRVAAMIECACLGLGLIQLPMYIIKNYLQSGQLVEVLPDIQKQDGHIYYYFPKYRYTQPKIRAFIDFFLKEKHDYR